MSAKCLINLFEDEWKVNSDTRGAHQVKKNRSK